jgi:type VI secretion system protein ImpF
MARVHPDEPLVPSVYDRLIDDDVTTQRELPKSRQQVLRELKQSVRRDLQDLLNTRWRCRAWPPDLDELELSVVNYGIPDFTSADMATAANRARLRDIVQNVLVRFEPRFQSVRVELLENTETDDRILRFRINALLHAEPAPEPVVFDSQLEPASADFRVTRHDR